MIERHGFSVGFERNEDYCFLRMRVYGKLSHEDYQQMSPLIENALKGVENAHVTALIDIREFEGWDIRAAWDDFRIGLKEGRKFSKIAILGNSMWLKNYTNIGRWFISGHTEFFENEADALAWLNEE